MTLHTPHAQVPAIGNASDPLSPPDTVLASPLGISLSFGSVDSSLTPASLVPILKSVNAHILSP